jgi:hypothetical protein
MVTHEYHLKLLCVRHPLQREKLIIPVWIKKWISICNAEPGKDDGYIQNTLKDLLEGYVAVTDHPAILFTGEMAAAFPDAKIICTTRDAEKWWVSMEDLKKMVRTS